MEAQRKIQDLIAELDAVGQLDDQLMLDACAELRGVIETNIRATRDPWGNAWAPRKADGAPAIQGALAKLRVVPLGKTGILMSLSGWEAKHNYGWVRGPKETRKRQVLPRTKQGLPRKWIDALNRAVTKFYERVMPEAAE